MSDPATTSPPSEEQSPASSDSHRGGISRRGFLKGAGLTAAGTALLEGVQSLRAETPSSASAEGKGFGPGPMPMRLHVNGKEHLVSLEPRTTLAEALRNHLGMTGTKVICDRGVCSGCTVWLDKVPVNSCMTLALDAIGHQVTTIEGITPAAGLHPVQAAFVQEDAMQCGFCTPGMVMSCAALLERNPHPTEADVRRAVSGNLCRCGTYPKVFTATLAAADKSRQA